MASGHRKVVTGYAQMWPREVFDIREQKRRKLLKSVKKLLNKSGVYILYRDEHPYYVGKTARPLFDRIWNHANQPKDKYYNFWNFFSVFEVPQRHHIGEVEGILIAAMPTKNSASPRIKRIDLLRAVARKLAELRLILPQRNAHATE